LVIGGNMLTWNSLSTIKNFENFYRLLLPDTEYGDNVLSKETLNRRMTEKLVSHWSGDKQKLGEEEPHGAAKDDAQKGICLTEIFLMDGETIEKLFGGLDG
jgi:hypothetical protein